MKEIEKPDLSFKENTLDRIIQNVAPSVGLKRRQARMALAMSGGYVSGRRGRRHLDGWRPNDGSADTEILPDLPSLRSRSSDLIRNEPLAAGAISTKVTNVVGTGLMPTPNIDRHFLGLSEEETKQIHAAITREWKLVSKKLDMTGAQDFAGLQGLAFRSTLERGDVFPVRCFKKRPGDVYGLKIKMIEADRCSDPTNKNQTSNKIVAGVELDSDAHPVAYHFSKHHPGDYGQIKNRGWDRIQAFDDYGQRVVLHLYFKLRIGQTRGVPDLAPVIEKFKLLSEYSQAEVTAAVVSALFTVFVETESGEGLAPAGPQGGASSGSDDVKMGPGSMIDLGPGEKVEFANPSRPNANFDPFIVAVSREISVGIDLPLDLVLKVFNSSYSASRAALDTAWQYFKGARGWLVDDFCNPVWGWFMEEAVASFRIPAPGFFDDPLIRQAYCGVIWNGPGRIHLDPKKEAESDKIYKDMGVKTLTEVSRERTGRDWEDKHEERKREVDKRREAGLEETPEPAKPAGFSLNEKEDETDAETGE